MPFCTNEKFLEKFNKTPQCKNIKITTKFIDNEHKIGCECIDCGYEWDAFPYSVLSGRTTCKSCRNIKRRIPFEEKIKDLENYKASEIFYFLEEKYVDSICYFKIKCKACGYEHEVRYQDLRKIQSCIYCNQLLTEEIFLKRFHNENPHAKDIILKSKFVNGSSKINCECKICGHTWDARPIKLLEHGCRLCSAKERNGKYAKGYEECEKQLNEKFSHIKFVNKVNRKTEKTIFLCTKHNVQFKSSLREILVTKTSGCPQCYTERIKERLLCNTDEFKKKLAKLTNSLEVTSEYVDSHTPINVKCINCGYEFSIPPDRLIQTPTCQNCGDTLSYPNKYLRAFMKQLNVDYCEFDYSPQWANKKRYDCYFEKDGKRYIIEMDGQQHYKNCFYGKVEKQRENDKLKDELAKNNGVVLIRINSMKIHKIKDYILNSELNKIFDLSKINFDECTRFAFNNLMYLVCNEYKNDENITVSQLANKFNISKDSVRRYLKTGNDANICVYNTEESKKRAFKFKKEQYMNNKEFNLKNVIICVETNQVYKSATYASKILNVHVNAITRCLKNKNFTCKGYHWVRYSESNKSLFNNINFDIVS